MLCIIFMLFLTALPYEIRSYRRKMQQCFSENASIVRWSAQWNNNPVIKTVGNETNNRLLCCNERHYSLQYHALQTRREYIRYLPEERIPAKIAHGYSF